ncbi:MAG: hypothetical protein K2Y01_05640 [Rhabdochlamydiaceae bacterium]|nr:hypothetical protein [Rhabdochlamydiaceae bacterium]
MKIRSFLMSQAFLMGSLISQVPTTEIPIEVLYSFNGQLTGAYPRGSLNLFDNVLYGRTASGGIGDKQNGLVFKINLDGSNYRPIYYFTQGISNGSGNVPHHAAMFTLNTNGTTLLYGAALQGGSFDRGTIFSVSPDNIPSSSTQLYNTVHMFTGGSTDASAPHSPPICVNSMLYGITAGGGSYGRGVIYQMEPSGANFTILYSFAEAIASTGTDSHGQLTMSSNGTTLYGMTREGGVHSSSNTSGCGVVFALNNFATAPSYEVLHEFGSFSGDGILPEHGFLTLVGNTLYGMTSKGGTNNNGTIFSIDLDNSNAYTILYSFGETGSTDGSHPAGSLVLSNQNIFYGLTCDGGANGLGTIFQISPDGSNYKTLASFNGAENGAHPYDNVTISPDGRTLYGMTQAGGVYDPTLSNNYGTIFAFHPPISSSLGLVKDDSAKTSLQKTDSKLTTSAELKTQPETL